MHVILSVLVLALTIAALIDIIIRDDYRVRHLPKLVWVFLVILLPLIGSIVWFAAGHDWSEHARPTQTYPQPDAAQPPIPRAVDTRTTEEQLADLEREIDEAERIRTLESELQRRRKQQR